MSKKTDYTWLATLCDAAADNPIPQHPWAIKRRGRWWTVATDHHGMLLVRGKYGEDGAAHAAAIESVAKLPDTRRDVVSLASLRRWAAVPALERVEDECPVCKGTGAIDCHGCRGTGGRDCYCPCGLHSHWIECEECAGKKRIACSCEKGKRVSYPNSLQMGLLYGRLFNRRLIDRFLAHVRAARVEVWMSPDPNTAVHFVTPEWQATVMPMRWDAAHDNAPEFPAVVRVAA